MKRFALTFVLLLAAVLLAASAAAVNNKTPDPSGYTTTISASHLKSGGNIDKSFVVVSKASDGMFVELGNIDYCCDDSETDKACNFLRLGSQTGLGGQEGLFKFKCRAHNEPEKSFSFDLIGRVLGNICNLSVTREGITFRNETYDERFNSPGGNFCLRYMMTNMNEESTPFTYADIDVDKTSVTFSTAVVDILLADMGQGPQGQTQLAAGGSKKASRLDKAAEKAEEEQPSTGGAGGGDVYLLSVKIVEEQKELAALLGRSVPAVCDEDCQLGLLTAVKPILRVKTAAPEKLLDLTRKITTCTDGPCMAIYPMSVGKYSFCYLKPGTENTANPQLLGCTSPIDIPKEKLVSRSTIE